MSQSTVFKCLLAFIGSAGAVGPIPVAMAEGNDQNDNASDEAAKSRRARDLEALIARVRENEQRYRQLETVVRTTTKAPDDDADGGLTLAAVRTVHTVVQDDLVYCRASQLKNTGLGGVPARDSVSAYDGAKTRSVEFGNSVNIHLGRHESPHVYPSHCLVLSHVNINFPLSVLLEGTEAMRRDPKVHHRPEPHGFVGDFHRVESTLDGEEDATGLRCVKILCRWWYDTVNAPISYRLWLAPERNYLCVKWQSGYDLRGREVVAIEGRVDEFRELAADLWLPARTTCTHYDSRALEERRTVVQRQDTLVVEKAVLNPSRPVAFFREIDIPEGLPVFTIENGRLAGPSFVDVAAPDSSADRLRALVEKVKAAEELYDNLAVELENNSRDFRVSTNNRRGGGGGRFGAGTREIEKSVRQGARSWYSEAIENQFDDGSTGHEETTEVGGEDWLQIVNRSLEQGNGTWRVTSRLVEGAPRRDRTHRPHMMLERGLQEDRPLSEMLTDPKAGGFHPGQVRVEWLAEEERADRPCEVVRLSDIPEAEGERGKRLLLWLARDRNYLPVHWEYYALDTEPHLPLGCHMVTEFREIAAGVWFPTKVSYLRFEQLHETSLSIGRIVIRHRTDYNVDKVTLNPEVPPERFAKIEVPEE